MRVRVLHSVLLGIGLHLLAACGTREDAAHSYPAVTLDSVTIVLPDDHLPNGLSFQAQAIGNYSNGRAIDVTALTLFAAEPGTGTATSSLTGEITGTSEGTVTIKGLFLGTLGETELTIDPPELVSIEVTPDTPDVAFGETQAFTATGTYTDGSTDDITADVTWSKTAGTGNATIDAAGVATATAHGTVTVIATLDDISGNTVMNVIPALVAISLSPGNSHVKLGTTRAFQAMGTFSDGSTSDVTADVTWASDTPAKVSIDAAGVVTGVAEGGAVISAESGAIDSSTPIFCYANKSFLSVDGFDSTATAVIKTPDGIYIGGYFAQYANTATGYLARFTSSLTVDGAFDVVGKFDGPITTLAAAADGKIYVGGYFTEFDGTSRNGLLRLETDGSLDAGFSVGTGITGTVLSLVVDGGGDIYVAGSFTAYDGNARNSVVRLNSDGSLDNGFDVGNGFTIGAAGTSTINALALNGDGLYVGGIYDRYDGANYSYLVRLDTAGAVDATFDIGAGPNNAVNSLLLAPDDDTYLYVGGNFTSFKGTARGGIVRVEPDGDVDPSFDPGDGFDTGLGYSDGPVTLLGTTDGSDDFYAGGYFSEFDGVAIGPGFMRLNAAGTRDAGFATGTGFTTGTGAGVSQAIFDGAQLIAVGDLGVYDGQTFGGVLKLETDGSVHADSPSQNGAYGNVMAVASTEDATGDIYVGGNFYTYQDNIIRSVVRVNDNGSLDGSFAPTLDFAVRTLGLALDNSGDLYVAGIASNPEIRRLNANGTADGGFTAEAFNAAGLDTLTLLPASGGDVYVAGGFDQYDATASNAIVRINADGSLDAGFDVGTGFNSTAVYALARRENSTDIYVGGGFASYDGTASAGLIRLNADGSIDAGFNIGSGVNGPVYAITPLNDGSDKIYVGGDFDVYNGTNVTGLIRLNANGTLDGTFTSPIDRSVANEVTSIALDTDRSGDFYITGTFDISAVGLARLDSSGTQDMGFNPGTTGLPGVRAFTVSDRPGAYLAVSQWGAPIYRGSIVHGVTRVLADGDRE